MLPLQMTFDTRLFNPEPEINAAISSPPVSTGIPSNLSVAQAPLGGPAAPVVGQAPQQAAPIAGLPPQLAAIVSRMRTPESYQPEIDQNQASIATLADQISKGTPMPLEQRIAVGLATILPALFSKGASAKAGLEYVQQDEKNWLEQDKLNREIGLRTMTSAQEDLRNLRNNQTAAERDRTGLYADWWKMNTQFEQGKELKGIEHGYNMEEIKARDALANKQLPGGVTASMWASAYPDVPVPANLPNDGHTFEALKDVASYRMQLRAEDRKDMEAARRQTKQEMDAYLANGKLVVPGTIPIPGVPPTEKRAIKAVDLQARINPAISAFETLLQDYKENGITSATLKGNYDRALDEYRNLSGAGASYTGGEQLMGKNQLGISPLRDFDSFKNWVQMSASMFDPDVNFGESPEARVTALIRNVRQKAAVGLLNFGYIAPNSWGDIPESEKQRIKNSGIDGREVGGTNWKKLQGYGIEGAASPYYQPPENPLAIIADGFRPQSGQPTAPSVQPTTPSPGISLEAIRAEKARRAAQQGGVR